MILLFKNRLVFISIALLALAGIVLAGYLKTRTREYQDIPTLLVGPRTQNNSPFFSSELETNAPVQEQAAASASSRDQLPTPLTPIRGAQKTAAATIALSDIKACMVRPLQEIGKCYDALFGAFLKTNTTAEALKIVAHFEETDPQLRYACHPVVHAIGRETFAKTGTVHDSFAACDQTCHSGCYHGAMERFIRGDQGNDSAAQHISDKELETKTTTACPADQPSRFRFQCLHGLGHALLFSLDYKLEKTLGTCDKLLTAWDRSSCWGGIFMENLFPSDPAKMDVSPTDYHYPCSKLGDQYKNDCYVMQTTRMSTMGLDATGLFTECRKAGAYTLSCIQSIGRDLSNDARIKDPRLTSVKCELGENDQEHRACIRGVIYALIDNTWDGRYAFPFCQTFAVDSNSIYCAATSAQYLRVTYGKSKETVLNDCVLRTRDQAACEETVREL